MLPSLAGLVSGETGVWLKLPDDALSRVLENMAVSLDKTLETLDPLHPEYSRIMEREGFWKEVFDRLAGEHPHASDVVDELRRSGMTDRDVWRTLASRFERCGALRCGPRVFMKSKERPVVGNDVSDATFVANLTPVEWTMPFSWVPDRDSTNTVLWYACVPPTRDVVYAEDIPLVPESEVVSSEDAAYQRVDTFVMREQEASKHGNPCNSDLFPNDFAIQADHLAATVTFTFPWMDMCRMVSRRGIQQASIPSSGEEEELEHVAEPASPWSPWSQSASLIYMWNLCPAKNVPGAQEALDSVGAGGEGRVTPRGRWWFYVGVLPDEPKENRMRLRVREFGLWREDEP
jgi:hypothetical protein